MQKFASRKLVIVNIYDFKHKLQVNHKSKLTFYKPRGTRTTERVLMKSLNSSLCGYGSENGAMGDILQMWQCTYR